MTTWESKAQQRGEIIEYAGKKKTDHREKKGHQAGQVMKCDIINLLQMGK